MVFSARPFWDFLARGDLQLLTGKADSSSLPERIYPPADFLGIPVLPGYQNIKQKHVLHELRF